MCPRDRLRFFDQVGHQTMSASMGNKHHQTYQNYEREKLGTFLENKLKTGDLKKRQKHIKDF